MARRSRIQSIRCKVKIQIIGCNYKIQAIGCIECRPGAKAACSESDNAATNCLAPHACPSAAARPKRVAVRPWSRACTQCTNRTRMRAGGMKPSASFPPLNRKGSGRRRGTCRRRCGWPWMHSSPTSRACLAPIRSKRTCTKTDEISSRFPLSDAVAPLMFDPGGLRPAGKPVKGDTRWRPRNG